MRLDQWLYSVRLYRTRTLATAAIKDGQVKVGEVLPKPAREVHPGEIVTARTGEITRTYRILGEPKARVSAPAVPQFAEDLTPPEEFTRRQRELQQPGIPIRNPRAGRPTKRDRRQLDRLTDGEF
jgi:ribosome-associated heat shock protein Hsp15